MSVVPGPPRRSGEYGGSATPTPDEPKFCPHCHTRLDRKSEPVLPAEHFDNGQRAIVVNGDVRRLRPYLWQLLLIFWERQDRVLSHDVLFTLLYNDQPDTPEGKTLQVYICMLRGALRGSPYMIETTHAEGYLFTAKRQPKVRPALEFGTAEHGVPLPQRKTRQRPPGVLEHLRQLQPGQSLVIRNTSLPSVKSTCRNAGYLDIGTFIAAPTEDGAVRVWRR